MIIENEFYSCRNISEDVQTEDNDDEEGTKVTTATHDDRDDYDSVEDEDDDETNDMDDTDAKDEEHQPLLLTHHQLMQQPLDTVPHCTQHGSSSLSS